MRIRDSSLLSLDLVSHAPCWIAHTMQAIGLDVIHHNITKQNWDATSRLLKSWKVQG